MGSRAREHTISSPAKLKEHLNLSLHIIPTAAGILINLFIIRSAEEPISKNPSLIVACASAFMSLISGFCLAIDTVKRMTTLSSSLPMHLVRDSRCPWSSKLFHCMSITSTTFTAISIIVSVLPKAYYYLPVVFLPTLLVIGVSFYDGSQSRNLTVTLGHNDPHKDERERSFQLAVSMTGFSFAGALGTIIGYHKNYSNQATHVYILVSIYLMLGATITGLSVLLLSRMRRIDWKKTAVGNAIALCLLVIAVLIVSATFLGAALSGTLFPVAIAAAIWYFFEYHVPRGDLDAVLSKEEVLKLLYSAALAAMSASFGAVMTTFAGFLGGQANGGRLEAFIFFVVSCFISSVTLGVITFKAPARAGIGAAARALACISFVLFVLAGLALFPTLASK